MYRKLIKNNENISADRCTIFCFPFAGGGASAYNSWIKAMKPYIDVCPIQLPGREERISEEPYEDFLVLVNDLENALLKCIKGKYVLFGHSFGAKIAYELEKRMEKAGLCAEGLFVSGCRAPHISEPDPIGQLPDEEFQKKLQKFNGTPKEILENQELMEFFLPMLRADFIMDETYSVDMESKVQCPIWAFAGSDDKEATEDEMREWQRYTEDSFEYNMFCGEHFFIRSEEEGVISKIRQYLDSVWEEGRHGEAS